MTQLLPPKKEVALALLERSNVDVYLDPRARGVVVPPQFRKEPRLILKIGLNMPVPIPDLRLDDESMSCTLSFNRSPFYCVVPWSSVFAMVGEDGRGMVWPDDVPQELAAQRSGASPSPPARDVAGRAAPPLDGPRTDGGSPAGASPSSRRGGRTNGGRERLAAAPDDAASSPSARKAAGKKKKKDENRPVLVAVPSGSDRDAGEARRSSPAGGAEGRDENVAEPRREGVAPAAPAAPAAPVAPVAPVASRPRAPVPGSGPPAQRGAGAGGARPKRELPPYLRVVK